MGDLAILVDRVHAAHLLKPDPHYVLGKPYTTDNVWFYPRESYDLDETGLAVDRQDRRPGLTTDGELFDQTALAAAHPTIQLPAIARLTNLDNGRRGHRAASTTEAPATRTAWSRSPVAPPRCWACHRDGVARVRLHVLPNESHAAADALPGRARCWR